ncbi:hypothetical protein BN13_420082 [Nostocoides jenkinsii Ben 74]|uniref:Uncharacterized protein n=1 Tax=Nostocoides jenkinsii Ben 74 TaxID=1193518 RepID=A0A077MF10_9MICO|nr:hypothetical protein BN13_420082 [Tetrasphaera jenkinsii Ben 74]
MSPMTANRYGVAFPSAGTAPKAVLTEAALAGTVPAGATEGAGLAWAGRKVANAATAAAAGANERTRMKGLLAHGNWGDCATAIPSPSTIEAVGGVGRGAGVGAGSGVGAAPVTARTPPRPELSAEP